MPRQQFPPTATGTISWSVRLVRAVVYIMPEPAPTPRGLPQTSRITLSTRLPTWLPRWRSNRALGTTRFSAYTAASATESSLAAKWRAAPPSAAAVQSQEPMLSELITPPRTAAELVQTHAGPSTTNIWTLVCMFWAAAAWAAMVRAGWLTALSMPMEPSI